MNDQKSPSAADDSGEAASSGSSGEQPLSIGLPERPPLFERFTNLFRTRNGASIRDDLADALAGNEGDGETFSPGERAMLKNILRLREVRVEDVMVPRADIEAVEISTSLGELLSLFERSGHSRMPVYAESLDDPRGMIHIRDVVGFVTRAAAGRKGRPRQARKEGDAAQELDLGNVDLSRSLSELGLTRPVLFVPPSMLASDLMARMQAQRIQMALVIDEYGGTDGLVSLEDIVEMVVGDIEDEHDDDDPLITEAADGVLVVDARAEIDDVAEKIGAEFSAGEFGEDVDTIGGLIFNALGRVPARGEVVQAVPGFEFQVIDADPRRVKRVRIVPVRNAERRRAQRVVQG